MNRSGSYYCQLSERIRTHLFGARKDTLVIIQCPGVDHYYCILRNEESIIPIIFSHVMVYAEFQRGPPSKSFLPSNWQQIKAL